MQMSDMCSPALPLLDALPLPDAQKHAPSKFTWDMYSSYQLKSTYFERVHFREYENENARHVCSCNTPPRCPKACTLKIDVGHTF